MKEQIPLIGNEKELAYIESIIQEWGTRRILCIGAPAGAGKTFLLEEIRKRCTNDHYQSVPIMVTDILDFADRGLHTFQNIGCKIAHALGEKLFEPYLRVLLNWRKMEMSGVGLEQLSQSSLAVNQTFVECFKMVSARVIVFMDSVEAIPHDDLVNFIVEMSKHLENVLIILAGRNATGVGDSLKSDLGKDVQVLEIKPFSQHTAEAYIYRKQLQLHESVDPSIIPMLRYMTGGNPVLLDLATERYIHQPISPAWLVEHTPDELMALPDDKRKKRQDEFHRELARYAADTQSMEGWLTLLMSYIYPVDAAMIASLASISEESAREFVEKMGHKVFVKRLPYQRLCLQDDVRHIVADTMWSEIDPTGEKKRDYSSCAAHYLAQTIESMTQRLDQMHAVELAEVEAHDSRSEIREMRFRDVYVNLACDHFLERAVLERDIDDFQIRQLCYALVGDNREGVRTFAKMFDDATQSYHVRLRKILLKTMQEYYDHIDPEDVYEFDRRNIVCLFDDGAYDQVVTFATEQIEKDSLTVDQQVDMLIMRGNALLKQGCPDKGITDFEHALKMCEEHGLHKQAAAARQARGLAHCNQGRYDLALEEHIEAFMLALKMSDMEQVGWILPSISFINAIRGNRQGALESGHAALDLWFDMGNPRGIAVSYNALGEAFVRFNQPSDALVYYTRSLDIFSREQDIEWISVVRCGRAFAYQSLREFERAEIEQEWVLNNGSIVLKPRILHSQFLTSLARGDIAAARQHLKECRAISQHIGDQFNDYKSFADLIEMAWECEEFADWQKYYDEHTRLYAVREGIDALRLRGSCLRKIADMAICSGAYDEAVNLYQQALPLIAEHEVHERYTIRTQLRQTDKRLRDRVPDTVMQKLGSDLASFWQVQPDLIRRFPEVLLLFRKW